MSSALARATVARISQDRNLQNAGDWDAQQGSAAADAAGKAEQGQIGGSTKADDSTPTSVEVEYTVHAKDSATPSQLEALQAAVQASNKFTDALSNTVSEAIKKASAPAAPAAPAATTKTASTTNLKYYFI